MASPRVKQCSRVLPKTWECTDDVSVYNPQPYPPLLDYSQGGNVVQSLWSDEGTRSPPCLLPSGQHSHSAAHHLHVPDSHPCTLSGGWSLLVGAPLTPCSLPGQDIVSQPGIHRRVQEPMSASRLPCHVGILPAQTAGTF